MTYIATSEITTLKHKLGNDTMKRRSFIPEAMFASAKCAEVLDSLGGIVGIEFKNNPAGLGYSRIKNQLDSIVILANNADGSTWHGCSHSGIPLAPPSLGPCQVTSK
jgi:hypothetical protein